MKYQTGQSPTLINLDELLENLGKCGASAKFLLVDACRNQVNARSVDSSKVSVPEGVAALFSCKSGEVAFETKKLGTGHGVFFYHVIQAMKGKAVNDKGEVTWGRLAEFVSEKVSEGVPELIGGGARQTPHEIRNLVGLPPALAVREVARTTEAPKVQPPVKLTKNAQAEFEKGRALFDARNKSFHVGKAAEHFRAAADEGHPQAQVALAFLHVADIGGVPRNRTLAWQLADRGAERTRAAAAKGDAFSQVMVGMMHFTGISATFDPGAAADWFEKAADQGLPLAQSNLGYLLCMGIGRAQDTKKGMQLLEKAAARNFAPAQVHMGRLYLAGRIVQQDPARAFEYFEAAAKQEFAPGQMMVCEALFQGVGVQRNQQLAAKYCTLAAEQHLAHAQYKLGSAYLQGHGVRPNTAEARKWLTRAANANVPEARFMLAWMALSGW